MLLVFFLTLTLTLTGHLLDPRTGGGRGGGSVNITNQPVTSKGPASTKQFSSHDFTLVTRLFGTHAQATPLCDAEVAVVLLDQFRAGCPWQKPETKKHLRISFNLKSIAVRIEIHFQSINFAWNASVEKILNTVRTKHKRPINEDLCNSHSNQNTHGIKKTPELELRSFSILVVMLVQRK